MQSSSRAHKTMPRVLRVLALTIILSASAACGASTTISEQAWRTQIVQVPLPKTGCFKATYPSLQWQAVACVTPPPTPLLSPARGGLGPANGGSGALGPTNVGGCSTCDFSAKVSPSLIYGATGSFPTVSVTGESDANSGVANEYTLQLNTNYFINTPACNSHPGCAGWVQFAFVNGQTFADVYVEDWLLDYNAYCTTSCTCPAPFTPDRTHCLFATPSTPYAFLASGPQPITNLQCLSLTGTATGGTGGMDEVKLVVGGPPPCPTDSAYATGYDNLTDLASYWTEAEFNVFGLGNSQAKFNPGSTITVETTVHYDHATAAPVCDPMSFTAETNNLTLVGAPSFTTAPSPAIEFTESNIPGTPASCAAASGTGETHLLTFSGSYYDFQATGDFLLAQNQEFAVQTRQVSGAPKWPNASVNHAVATQMGHTRVALCAAAPAPLVVDGNPTALADGQTLALPSGVHVLRTGNVYLVTDPSGNSMRAVMWDSATTHWIDVYVGLGLGTRPTQVRGLLANANGNVHELEASDGTVFTTPISFADLYGHYGESWRVAPADSLLSDCGGAATENSVPSKPFFARDLAAQAPSSYAQARATCTHAGVTVPVLLDACTLDVAFFGSEKAATLYVGAPAPAAVVEAGQAPSGGQG